MNLNSVGIKYWEPTVLCLPMRQEDHQFKGSVGIMWWDPLSKTGKQS